jgi:hypothetical protein
VTGWNEAIQTMVAKMQQETTPTPPADPWKELKEAAAQVDEDRRVGRPVLAYLWLQKASPTTILALLAERERLTKGLIALEQAVLAGNAALRKSEERAGKLPDLIQQLSDMNNWEPDSVHVWTKLEALLADYDTDEVTSELVFHLAGQVLADAIRATLTNEATDD